MAIDNDIMFYKNEFNTEIMYYYVFNKASNKKNNNILRDLIQTHHGVYKIVYELLSNSSTTLIDYDQLTNKEQIYADDYIISRLFVLKRSETKNNMVYSNFENVLNNFSSDPNKTTFDLYLRQNTLSDDTDLNRLLLGMLLDNNFNLANNSMESNNIRSSSTDIERIKLTGSLIQLFPTIRYLRSKFESFKQFNLKPENLNEYSKDYIPKMIKTMNKLLTDIETNPDKYTNIWFNYSIKSIMY